MPKRFSKQRPPVRKTQVSLFFISIIATLILITFVTINIGKVAKDKTFAGNAADGGALSAASVMAYAFNYAANANEKGKNDALENNHDEFKQAYDKWFQNVYKQEADEYAASSNTISGTYCPSGPGLVAQVEKEIIAFILQVTDLKTNVIPSYQKKQNDFYQKIREKVHDDGQGTPNDLYNIALSTGQLFNFSNSGTSHRLGKISQKMYSQFLQQLEPGQVRSGEPKTFTWVDGAGRVHIVFGIIIIEPAQTYTVKVTGMDYSTVTSTLQQSIAMAQQALGTASAASSAYAGGDHFFPCGIFTGPCLNGVGDGLMQQVIAEMESAREIANSVHQGLDASKDIPSGSKGSLQNEIIKYIVDIQHSRLVCSTNFQFHMGGPIKGMRGDIDTPTFYPPITSSAIASFRGSGSIHPQRQAHDASLKTAF